MKFTTCIFVIAILTSHSAAAQESSDDAGLTRVFIFAGQSNMVGSDAHADRIDNYPAYAGVGKPQEDVLYSYLLERDQRTSDGWIPLQPVRS